MLKVPHDLAGFSPGPGELLRRALGSKQGAAALERFRGDFLAGAQANGVTPAVAETVFDQLRAFGGYAFAKSHAAVFAVLVYQSAWLKRYHPAAFLCALLNHQPMGFWLPAVLVGDARRRGITVLPVNIQLSEAECVLEAGGMRLGFNYVDGFGDAASVRLVAARQAVGWVSETIPGTTKPAALRPSPSPDATEAQKESIRALAEELDAHRKRQQAQHPKLTLTEMYNVLEKLKEAEAKAEAKGKGGPPQPSPQITLTAKEKTIHQQGLVSILRQLHDDLDAAVFAAYGWPATLSDDEILERLVALNAARAAEEAAGTIRWLRPDYQAPDAAPVTTQPTLLDEGAAVVAPAQKQPWPKSMAEQAQAVRAALHSFEQPVTAAQVAAAFQRAPRARLAELLDTLVSLGQARRVDGGYVG